MNRTALFLSAAAALVVAALLLGGPRGGPGAPPPSPPSAGGSATAGGPLLLTARLSHPVLPADGGDLFLTVDVQGAAAPGQPRRAPVNLALVIDRSGSMAGEKLAGARRAARRLIEQLTPEDRLAIVHYGSDVGVLPAAAATGEARARMLAFVDALHDEGGTNIGAGLEEARRQLLPAAGAFRTSRAILLSDGQPTEGRVEPGALEAVVRGMRGEGLSVSALGVGEDFNEDLMQALAEHGAGAYGYLRDTSQLAALFQRDLQQAATVVAQRVELHLALPDGVELGEVLGYRADVQGRQVRLSLPDLASGQQERVVVRLRAAGGAPVGQRREVAALQVAYRDALAGRDATAGARLSAAVSARAGEVAAAQDRDATVTAARAVAAQNTRLAADALAAGRPEEARAQLLRNLHVLEQAREVAGEDAVQADLEEQAQLRAVSEAAAGAPAERPAAAKALKAQARKGAGQLGSTY
jgi:Ca-activated chloride channel family protein